MPNGNPNFDLDEQEAWFAPIAATIVEFAHAHNLVLDKYYHESCSWDLRFNHPSGGRGAVTVYNSGPDAAQVGSVWYIDEYDRFTRFIHWRHPRNIVKDPEAIQRELAFELAAIVAVPLGHWNQIADGYEPIWGRQTKQEFETMVQQYPYPRVDGDGT